jgi:hypothetical protein
MRLALAWPARLLGFGAGRADPVATALSALALAFFAFTVHAYADDISRFAGVDLRPKVVGARQLVVHADPYVIPPAPPASEHLIDPLQRYPGPSRVSYPPTLLLFLYGPLLGLSYGAERLAWASLEWLALLGILVVGARSMPDRTARLAWIAAVTFGVAGSLGWRLHVERGQYYVFLALLVVAAGARLSREPRDLLAGVLLGVAIGFRPTLALIPVLLWLATRTRAAVAALATGAGMCVATLPWTGVAVWKSYFGLVEHYQRYLQVGGHRFGPAIGAPRVVEGMNIASLLDLPASNTSFRVLYEELASSAALRALLPMDRYRLWSSALTLAITALGALVALGLRRARRSPRLAFAWAVTAALAADIVLAPIRYPYCDVLLLAALAPLLPLLTRHRPYRGLLVLVLAALGTWITLPGSLPRESSALQNPWIANTVLLGAGGAIAITVALRPPRRRRDAATVEPRAASAA